MPTYGCSPLVLYQICLYIVRFCICAYVPFCKSNISYVVKFPFVRSRASVYSCLFLHAFVSMPVYLSAYMSVRLSVCQSNCLSV